MIVSKTTKKRSKSTLKILLHSICCGEPTTESLHAYTRMCINSPLVSCNASIPSGLQLLLFFSLAALFGYWRLRRCIFFYDSLIICSKLLLEYLFPFLVVKGSILGIILISWCHLKVAIYMIYISNSHFIDFFSNCCKHRRSMVLTFHLYNLPTWCCMNYCHRDSLTWLLSRCLPHHMIRLFQRRAYSRNTSSSNILPNTHCQSLTAGW